MENIIETFWYSDFKKVYDSLQDRISEEIFKSRVLYSVTGNAKCLLETAANISPANPSDKLFSIMFCTLNKALQDIENKSIEYIDSIINAGKEIVICGAKGVNASRLYKIMRCKNVVLADKRSDGKKYIDYETAVKSYKNALWVIPCNEHLEIKNELLLLGIKESEIIHICMRDNNYWVMNIIDKLYGEEISEKYVFSIQDRNEYFDEDIMKPVKDEVFVDCGFYDGKNSYEFIKWCKGNYKKIIAFEADSRLCEKKVRIDRMELINAACWETDGIIRFKKTNDVTELGFVDDYEETDDKSEFVAAKSIDKVLDGEKATFIKMDIEGSEMKALRGARKTIAKYKPRLAISVYHRPEDIIEILVYLLSLNKNYKFYLRAYEYTPAGVVLYAI